MKQVVLFALFAMFVAGITPKLIEQVGRTRAATATVAPDRGAPAPETTGRGTVLIRRDDHGHFRIDGLIDGRRMTFLVDTGASLISLTEKDAARLSIRPTRSEYTAEVRTANGSLHAAPTRLPTVEVGSITLRDVPALVLPDSALSENLLGLSFLSRLKRFEYSNGRLLLEQ
jgi:aspartyl protease family protein